MQKNFNGTAQKNYENVNGLDITLICTDNQNNKMFEHLRNQMSMHNSYIHSFSSVSANLVPLKCTGLDTTLICTVNILNQIPCLLFFLLIIFANNLDSDQDRKKA